MVPGVIYPRILRALELEFRKLLIQKKTHGNAQDTWVNILNLDGNANRSSNEAENLRLNHLIVQKSPPFQDHKKLLINSGLCFPTSIINFKSIKIGNPLFKLLSPVTHSDKVPLVLPCITGRLFGEAVGLGIICSFERALGLQRFMIVDLSLFEASLHCEMF